MQLGSLSIAMIIMLRAQHFLQLASFAMSLLHVKLEQRLVTDPSTKLHPLRSYDNGI
jgi:hypothetical protein